MKHYSRAKHHWNPGIEAKCPEIIPQNAQLQSVCWICRYDNVESSYSVDNGKACSSNDSGEDSRSEFHDQ
jgi:hypothetical protein